MEVLNRFKAKAQQQPKNFWIYNFVASLVYFIIFQDQVLSLILFPTAVALIHYFTTNILPIKEIKPYLGFYPLSDSVLKILIAVIINFVIWDHALLIILGILLFLYLSDAKVTKL